MLKNNFFTARAVTYAGNPAVVIHEIVIVVIYVLAQARNVVMADLVTREPERHDLRSGATGS